MEAGATKRRPAAEIRRGVATRKMKGSAATLRRAPATGFANLGAVPFPMRQDQIIAVLTELRPALEAEGVTHLALFGSRARGDNRPDSDIDLLVDVDPESRFSILNLVGVEQIVSDTTGMAANAFMRRSLEDRFRQTIAAEIVPVF